MGDAFPGGNGGRAGGGQEGVWRTGVDEGLVLLPHACERERLVAHDEPRSVDQEQVDVVKLEKLELLLDGRENVGCDGGGTESSSVMARRAGGGLSRPRITRASQGEELTQARAQLGRHEQLLAGDASRLESGSETLFVLHAVVHVQRAIEPVARGRCG